MDMHPEGIDATRRLVETAGLGEIGSKSIRILDMGCGNGDTVRFLGEKGYEAVGIDINLPDLLKNKDYSGEMKANESKTSYERKGGITYLTGDFLNSNLEDCSFDAIISQCSFFVSGDIKRAYSEAIRLLKPAGKLMVSDVKFDNMENPKIIAQKSGFEIEYVSDDTKAWQKYYIQSIWDGDDCGLCGFVPDKKLGKCGYYSMVCKKTGV